MENVYAPYAWFSTVVEGLRQAVERDKPDAYQLAAVVGDVYETMLRESTPEIILSMFDLLYADLKASLPGGAWSVLNQAMYLVRNGGKVG